MLNQMYNSDWQYATDSHGRACINSDPAHWPLILNWLSFGSVPDQPSTGFLAECRYWQLDNLLARLQQDTDMAAAAANSISISTPEHTFSISEVQEHDQAGFLLEGDIHDFVQQSARESPQESGAVTRFKAFGINWFWTINRLGIQLHSLDGPWIRPSHVQVSFGGGRALWRMSGIGKSRRTPTRPQFSWEGRWPPDGWTMVRSQPYVNLKGDLHVALKLLFPPTMRSEK